MLSLKCRSRLIFGGILLIFLLVLAIVNANAFLIDGVLSIKNILSFASVTSIAVILLLFDIKLPDKVKNIVSWVIFALGPVICFEMVRVVVNAPKYQDHIYFENLIFYALVQLLVFAITQSSRISLVVSFTLSYCLHLANQLVLLLRGTPLVPTDLYAAGTALTVTNPSEWHFDFPLLLGTASFLACIGLALACKITFKKVLKRIACGAVALIMAVSAGIYIWNLDYKSYSTSTFDTESTNRVNGVMLSFYINARKMKIDPPVGYSEQALNEALSKYTESELSSDVELPNIIVIMNESFSDLSYIGNFRTNIPYMPYFNSLADKYPSGRLAVSVLGGGTCNTEFEFLTNLSMMYLPNGSYAYMQHVTGEIPSVASQLGEYGYKTIAMHPFYEICWKRNSVYKFMGFDDYVSGEDMSENARLYQSVDRWEKGFGDDVEYVRTLISDSFFYDRVIEQFEAKGDSPAFIFGVTVQNHSGYEYDGEDFVADVKVTSPEGIFPKTEQYLSLVKKSDEALEELINYFEGVDEKTLIIFFGDHQPNVDYGFTLRVTYGGVTVNDFLTRYETPFVVWSNYEIDAKNELGIISANNLSIKMLEYAGIPLTQEQQLIKEALETAPAMTTWGYMDKFSCWTDRKEIYSAEALNAYGYLTYKTLKK